MHKRHLADMARYILLRTICIPVILLLHGGNCKDVTNQLDTSPNGLATTELPSAASGHPLLTPSALCKKYQCGCLPSDSVAEMRVDCSYKSIDSMDRLSVPLYVVEIDLSGNNFTVILDYYFYVGEGVHVLDLSHNSITFVAMRSLHGLMNLGTLTLAHNKLHSLEEDVFGGLTKLRNLDLSYNRISTLLPTYFENLSDLEDLNLAHNPLMELSGSAFNQLKSLNHLNLQSTGLRTLKPDDFRNLANLKALDLSSNAFDAVPLSAMRTMTQLRHLDLSSNLLHILPPFSFYNLTSLRSLNLKYMINLKSIEHHAFSDVASLKIVDLSFSPHLKRIDKLAFTFNSTGARIELDSFYARQTGLETLSSALLQWDYVNEVDLAENPWICDCRLSWMQDLINIDVTDGKLRCASPEALAGRLVTKLKTADMCSNMVTLPTVHDVSAAMKVVLGLLIVVSIVLAVVIVTMIYMKIRSRKPNMYMGLKERISYNASAADE
ncbi:carboxypeptidase N subunit 2-like [Ornithodoros turicata]|uniref:carboxypeptidase N subunit 2-like n=1 Tax=Ornithodoros turicata TaxID=34597 RepID=UPI00313A1064